MTYEEDVGGQVIGRYMLPCSLRYEGRQQGKTFFVEDEDEAKRIADERLIEIRTELGAAFIEIYPRNAWELTIRYD